MKQRRIRVIPSLLVRRGGLYKGEKFKNHKYVGDPINTVRIFNEKEVDEIAILDIEATKEGTGPNFSMLRDIATEAFMPLSYGGGISTAQQAEQLFKLGIEKIIINSLAGTSLDVLRDISNIAGAQSLMLSVDVKRSLFGKAAVYTHAGTHNLKIAPPEYAQRAQDAGVGEILLTSIEREGTLEGFDLDLVSSVTSVVDIPVIASGGAASPDDIIAVTTQAGASAAAIGRLFTLKGKHNAVLISYLDEPLFVDYQRPHIER